ncbi:hypothetical protein HPP92_024795 [Vanilla planifolia]|uniref:HhH-GPD domain-containing protein n=1 Tax=Vanilla planifolia TaxID=51239 RepID=A0A835UBQ1_VANPL|nr:hypothetical protein HPP92_024795 [Vanilla planifolia]
MDSSRWLNHWDPITRTFNRPLRLSSSSGYCSIRVNISHPCPSSPLIVSIAGLASLSPEDEEAVLVGSVDQVRRMMRMSEDNDRIIQEFHRVHADSRERGFGRVFRSPTLFEDMIKCILLCNCQWPRTLSMARALCELQPQMKGYSSAEAFHPKTPQKREMKRKRRPKKNKVTMMSERKFVDGEAVDPENPELKTNQNTNSPGFHNLDAVSQSCQDQTSFSYEPIGNFPMPEDLAGCDPAFLASHCKLGYRAQRIVHLARIITDGKLELKKLEELCKGYSESSYELLEQQLMVLSGFGPFTRANVLMCMGFYHRVPADTETVRHIRQYHGRSSSLKCVQKDIEAIYGNYAPFQFLVYWSELWRYYEEKFGTWSKMRASSYQLVTASNMKDEIPLRLKDKNLESEEQ